jgi:ankyrin repeat protein
MHLAARRGDIEVLQRLLARGAPVDAVNAGGRTPLPQGSH